jgi:hypothetical protein
VVPPRSNRVSRAPPYSRTQEFPYPYRAVTVSGAPFQTLPVRTPGPLAWSAFARRYLRSRALGPKAKRSCCCPFLRLLRCFSSPGSPHAAIDSPHDTAHVRWVAPFGHPRITGRSPLPSAFRSVPRPSSPLGAKASTRCPSRAAPAPSPKHALARARQRSEDTDQRTDEMPKAPASLLLSVRCDLVLRNRRRHSPGRCSRIGHAYPCPGPTSSAEMMAGPASRSRLASRCHKIRTEGRRQNTRPPRISVTTRGPILVIPCQKTCRGLPSSVLRLLPSELTHACFGGPGPI